MGRHVKITLFSAMPAQGPLKSGRSRCKRAPPTGAGSRANGYAPGANMAPNYLKWLN